MTAGFANCMQNPEMGREKNMDLIPAETPKKVLIIGGGPAGLEAALVAGLRGHNVILCEKESRLGGQWNLAYVPPGKEDFRWVVDWRVDRINDLANVTVQTACEVNAATIKAIAPDVTIVATGSVPVIAPISGAQCERVVTAHSVLQGAPLRGQTALVIGGGATGSETAHYIVDQGKTVTIVEALPDIATDEMPARRVWLMQNLIRKGVTIATDTVVDEITDSGEVLVIRSGQKQSLGVFDSIVMATGVRRHNPLAAQWDDIEGERICHRRRLRHANQRTGRAAPCCRNSTGIMKPYLSSKWESCALSNTTGFPAGAMKVQYSEQGNAPDAFLSNR